MNIYIWDDLDRVSDNYHSGGGVVVVAESLEAARALFLKDYRAEKPSDISDKNPDAVYACDAKESRVFVFADAGCC